MGAKMNPLIWIALILVVVGGLNWGLVGVANFNLVNALLGSVPVLEKIVYIVVGIAAIAVLIQACAWIGKCGKTSQ